MASLLVAGVTLEWAGGRGGGEPSPTHLDAADVDRAIDLALLVVDQPRVGHTVRRITLGQRGNVVRKAIQLRDELGREGVLDVKVPITIPRLELEEGGAKSR